MKAQAFSLASLDKRDLGALCDRLLTDDADAIEKCIAFMEAETKGIWHGRARAKMARRLKHRRLSPSQLARVVDAILGRLASGRFSEQFKDQLRFVLRVAPKKAFSAARGCQGAAAGHVRRYAAWILSREARDHCA